MTSWVSKQLPKAVVVLWTAFLAAMVWAHIPVSPQPPIYDTFTYYQKAYNFWAAIHRGQWFNPLDLEPTMRPPGTVLMSYPFGFDRNPRGFYFRSIFLPAALMIVAALVAAHRRPHTRSHEWRAALIAVLFSTPSLFYHFAFVLDGWISYWGLVDGFQSGLAALAAASAWRSVSDRSIAWACAAAVTSSFCILIKPSGVLVSALIAIIWTALALASVVVAARTPLNQRATQPMMTRYIAGALIIGGANILVLKAALASAYLSDATLAWGRASIVVMKAELAVPSSLLWSLIRAGPGDAFVLWTALGSVIPATGLLFSRRAVTLDPRARLSIVAALAGLAALGVGLWFWLIFSGGALIVRYGMPFFAISMVCMVPAVTEFWRYAPRIVTACASFGMLVVPINLALLLGQDHPPDTWQRLTGISLSPGVPFAAIEDFRRFVAEPRSTTAVLYSFDIDEADQMMDSLAQQQLLFHPDRPPVLIRRPLDWVRPTTYRIEELVSSDYLLFRPEGNPHFAPQASANSFPQSFPEERAMFVSWASRLEPQDGIEVILDSPAARLLRVTDRTPLRQSVLRMVSAHRWRAIFTEANSSSF